MRFLILLLTVIPPRYSNADEYPLTLLDDIERNKDQCQDIEGFKVIINEEIGRLAPCSWIDDGHNFSDVTFRREAQCRKPYVRFSCKRACGTCCADNKDHTFEYLNSETGETKEVDCAWLARRSENKKKEICSTKKGSCPEACGECDGTPITYPKDPSESPCRDDSTFKITFEGEKGRKEPCTWIDGASNIDEVLFRRKEVCWKKEVKKACKRACGECCGDNELHLFKNTNAETGVTKLVTCEWLANRSDKKKKNICPLERGACPDACGECKSATPKPEDSSSACKDNLGFRLLIDGSTGREEPCSWIDDAFNIDEVLFRRKAQCKKPGVKENCKRACGKCCGDNDEHTFEYTNSDGGKKKEVNCEWLANSSEKRRKKLCKTKKGSCPEACGLCPIDSSELKPTTAGAGMITSEAIRHRLSSVVSTFIVGTTALGLLSI